MITFRTWMTNTRGKRSQVSCARRAGMTAQYWGWIEKNVEQPDEETVTKVAMGLEVSESVAKTIAGYASDSMAVTESEIREVAAMLADTPEPYRPAIMNVIRAAHQSFKQVSSQQIAA